MEAVILLLVMLAGVSNAFLQAGETKCNITPNSSLCSVALGGSVSLQLMTNASGRRLDFKKKLSNGFMNVFSLKKGKVTVHEAYRNRTEFLISSGTLKMTKMARNDSGQYSVEVFDENGIKLRNVIFTLDVQGNIWHILIPVCSAVAALLMVVLCCWVCCKVRRRRKTSKEIMEFDLEF